LQLIINYKNVRNIAQTFCYHLYVECCKLLRHQGMSGEQLSVVTYSIIVSRILCFTSVGWIFVCRAYE